MINLRKMMAPERVPFINDLSNLSISGIQRKMMTFHRENPRCVINAPRQIGKTTFILMDALLSDTKASIIVGKDASSTKYMHQMFLQLLDSNNLDYKKLVVDRYEMGKVLINNRTIIFVRSSIDYLNDNITMNNNNPIFIDEYTFQNINANLREANNVVLIGTPNYSIHEPKEEFVGVFAGLNINGDDI